MLIALADEKANPLGDSAGMRFAHNLRRRRQILDLTQAQLAERVAALGGSLYQQTIAKIESRTRGVSLDDAEALARALDTTVAQLLDGPVAEPGDDELSQLSVLLDDVLMAAARASDASMEAQRERVVAQQREDAARAAHMEAMNRYLEVAEKLDDAYEAARARGEDGPMMRIVEQQMEKWDRRAMRADRDRRGT